MLIPKQANKRFIIGKGFNESITTLPFEMHLFHSKGENVYNNGVPGTYNNQLKYSFCGPSTHLTKRLEEGYNGVNLLDNACKNHDIFHALHKDVNMWNLSDLALAKRVD